MNNDETVSYYAGLPYSIEIAEDRNGNHPAFVARHRELKGCKAQGDTVQEAVCNLAEARYDYIASLVEDGLRVPLPDVMRQELVATDTSLVVSIYFDLHGGPPSNVAILPFSDSLRATFMGSAYTEPTGTVLTSQ